MIRNHLFLTFILCCISYVLHAQSDSSKFTLSAYVESYYVAGFNQLSPRTRPNFLYNHNRADEFNVNLAFVKANYQHRKVRANLALMTGTYAAQNLANEPAVLRNIFEANVGVKVSKKYDMWLDMGVMPSHIGFESAISKDCWSLSRSLVAENSPYYETGLRFSYNNAKGTWYLAALVLNGWQHIRLGDGQKLGMGLQATYKPSSRFTFNYSNFVGEELVGSTRLYHNLYAIYQANSKWGITGGFDIGQEIRKNDNFSWYSPVAIVRYTPNSTWAFAARAEYFVDKDGVIIVADDADSFDMLGFSVNADYYILPNAVWRNELRLLQYGEGAFRDRNNDPLKSLPAFTTSLAVSF